MSMCCIIYRKAKGKKYSVHDFAKSDRGAKTVSLMKMLLLKASEAELPYDTAATLPGIDPENSIPGKRDNCSTMFIVLSAIARTWSQTSCPSTDEWTIAISCINRKLFSSKEKYTHNMCKKMRDSECLILSSEVSKSQKERYPHVCPEIQILACSGYRYSCQQTRQSITLRRPRKAIKTKMLANERIHTIFCARPLYDLSRSNVFSIQSEQCPHVIL